MRGDTPLPAPCCWTSSVSSVSGLSSCHVLDRAERWMLIYQEKVGEGRGKKQTQ